MGWAARRAALARPCKPTSRATPRPPLLPRALAPLLAHPPPPRLPRQRQVPSVGEVFHDLLEQGASSDQLYQTGGRGFMRAWGDRTHVNAVLRPRPPCSPPTPLSPLPLPPTRAAPLTVVSQRVEIVLTAHPTQVNRRTLQHKLHRCVACEERVPRLATAREGRSRRSERLTAAPLPPPHPPASQHCPAAGQEGPQGRGAGARARLLSCFPLCVAACLAAGRHLLMPARPPRPCTPLTRSHTLHHPTHAHTHPPSLMLRRRSARGWWQTLSARSPHSGKPTSCGGASPPPWTVRAPPPLAPPPPPPGRCSGLLLLPLHPPARCVPPPRACPHPSRAPTPLVPPQRRAAGCTSSSSPCGTLCPSCCAAPRVGGRCTHACTRAWAHAHAACVHRTHARPALHPHPQTLKPCPPAVAAALKQHTGRELPIDATPIVFGSWMGGDRDGNPNVTSKASATLCGLCARVCGGWGGVARACTLCACPHTLTPAQHTPTTLPPPPTGHPRRGLPGALDGGRPLPA